MKISTALPLGGNSPRSSQPSVNPIEATDLAEFAGGGGYAGEDDTGEHAQLPKGNGAARREFRRVLVGGVTCIGLDLSCQSVPIVVIFNQYRSN